MGLRDQAAADLRTILTDESGFGWSIWVQPPTGDGAQLTGYSTDVSLTIDPETGMPVSGRKASVALPLADLECAFGPDLLRGIAEKTSRPWLVRFNDVRGKEHTFKVTATHPDRALGVITCSLEFYKPRA